MQKIKQQATGIRILEAPSILQRREDPVLSTRSDEKISYFNFFQH